MRVVGAQNEPVSAGIERPAPTRRGEIWLVRSLNLAGGLWAAGILILACRLSWCQRHLRLLRLSLPTISTDPASQTPGLRTRSRAFARDLASWNDLSRRVSRPRPSPMLLGLRRPVIVLPGELTTIASPQHLRDVLVHECAHIARHDPWLNLLQQVATILFWVHPGVHWVNRQIGRAGGNL